MRVISIFFPAVLILAVALCLQHVGVLAAPVAGSRSTTKSPSRPPSKPPTQPPSKPPTPPPTKPNTTQVTKITTSTKPSSTPATSTPSNVTTTDPTQALQDARILAGREFVGYHGTNAANANVYQAAARAGRGIPVPPAFNGADAELGPGLYVSDSITVAQFYATTSANANQNRGNTANGANTAAICVVTDDNPNHWRNTVNKVWIPSNEIAKLVGGVNDPAKLALQRTRVESVAGRTVDNTVRFSVIGDDDNSITGNQLVIPSQVQGSLSIHACVPVSRNVNQLPADFGTPNFPTFNYQNQRQLWNIT